LKAVLAWGLARRLDGYLFALSDGPGRLSHAATYFDRPLSTILFGGDTWLPLPAWLYAGSLTLFGGDGLVALPAVDLLFAAAGAVVFYALGRSLGLARGTAFLAAAGVLCQVPTVYAAVVGKVHAVFVCAAALGVLAWVRFVSTRRTAWLFLSAASFTASAMSRHEGVLLCAGFVALLTACVTRGWPVRLAVRPAAAAAVLCVSFPAARAVASLIRESLFASVRIYGGAAADVLPDSPQYLLRHLGENLFVSPAVGAVLLVFFAVALFHPQRLGRAGTGSLLVFPAVHLAGLGALALLRVGHPGYFHLWLAVGLITPTVVGALVDLARDPAPLRRGTAAVLIGCLVVAHAADLVSIRGPIRVDHPPPLILKTGQALRSLWKAGHLDRRNTVLLETRLASRTPDLRTGDAIALLPFLPKGAVRFDRPHPFNFFNRVEEGTLHVRLDTAGNPTGFDLTAEEFSAKMRRRTVRLVLCHSASAREKLSAGMVQVYEDGAFSWWVDRRDGDLREEIERMYREGQMPSEDGGPPAPDGDGPPPSAP
jgi:hypothetical protein